MRENNKFLSSRPEAKFRGYAPKETKSDGQSPKEAKTSGLVYILCISDNEEKLFKTVTPSRDVTC